MHRGERDLFRGLGIEVGLKRRDDFLKVCETLTRMGVVVAEDELEQVCHILHKKGRYRIMHWKELYIIDGRPGVEMTVQDVLKRNLIAWLLDEWDLVEVEDEADLEPRSEIAEVKILSHASKVDWKLTARYKIGRRRDE